MRYDRLLNLQSSLDRSRSSFAAPRLGHSAVYAELRQPGEHIFRVQPAGDVDRHALPGVLIDDRQQYDWAA